MAKDILSRASTLVLDRAVCATSVEHQVRHCWQCLDDPAGRYATRTTLHEVAGGRMQSYERLWARTFH